VDPPPKRKTPAWAWLLVLVLAGVGVAAGYLLKSTAAPLPSSAAPDDSSEAGLSAPEPLAPEGGSGATKRPAPHGDNGWLRTVFGQASAAVASDGGAADAGLLAGAVPDAGRREMDAEETPRPKHHQAGVLEKDGWLTFWSSPSPRQRTASIQGVVRFAATQADLPLLQRGAEFGCPQAPVADPSLAVQNGRLANAVVFVHLDSIPERDGRATLSAARERRTVTIEDTGCMLEPHVSLSAGAVHNADGTFHRIQGYSGSTLLFDFPLYAGTTTSLLPTHARKGPTALKCAVHPWESAYISPAHGGFSILTGPDGAFHFDGIPNDETYVVEAWHERFGSQQVKVEAKDGPATVDFLFGEQATAAK
jgi:hypothetical protein